MAMIAAMKNVLSPISDTRIIPLQLKEHSIISTGAGRGLQLRSLHVVLSQPHHDLRNPSVSCPPTGMLRVACSKRPSHGFSESRSASCPGDQQEW